MYAGIFVKNMLAYYHVKTNIRWHAELEIKLCTPVCDAKIKVKTPVQTYYNWPVTIIV